MQFSGAAAPTLVLLAPAKAGVELASFGVCSASVFLGNTALEMLGDCIVLSLRGVQATGMRYNSVGSLPIDCLNFSEGASGRCRAMDSHLADSRGNYCQRYHL